MNNIKLHLGCGNKHIEGYTNIDVRYIPGVDAVDNIKYLRSYKLASVCTIYASHVLEHFSRWEYKDVLKRWHEILKPGGILRVAVPDFEAIVNYYSKTGDLNAIRGMMYGGQDYNENFHHWCWDFAHLKKDLVDVGFSVVERYDWRNTEHSHIDDFSQSYIPHLEKETGKLMSLNVQAIK
jgi:predicted SAM-dependent methyltransferase